MVPVVRVDAAEVARPRLPRSTLLIAGVLLAFVVPSYGLLRSWRWDHAPFHAAVETAGGMIALAVVLLLLMRRTDSDFPGHHLWLAASLLSMGLFDIIHSGAEILSGSAWLRGISPAIGGALMAMVWLPERWSRSTVMRRVPELAAAIVAPLALVLFFEHPLFAFSGVVARVLDAAGFAGFSAAAVFLLRRHRATGALEDLVFGNQAALFAAGDALFAFAGRWDGVWWLYHLCRLLAYAVILFYAFEIFRRLHADERFRVLAEAIPQLVWVAGPDGRYEYFNRRWYEYTGVRKGDEGADPWAALLHPEDAPRAAEAWLRSTRTGQPYELEYRLRGADGLYRWFVRRALPVRDDDGQVTRWFGTSTEIQGQKLAEEAALAAVKARDEFLSVASHEMKTPLTALKLQIALTRGAVESDRPDAHVVLWRLASLDRQVNRLSTLIATLLDVSRLPSGRIELQSSPGDLGDIVFAVTQRFEDECRQDGVTIRVEREGDLQGRWDASRVDQVVTNLLSNALKYGRGHPVELRAVGEGEKVTLSVRDQGIGIPQADLGRLFQKFERAVPSMQYPGLGLGLYIARELVTAMGGTIDVASAEGQGSTFTVRLPRGSNG